MFIEMNDIIPGWNDYKTLSTLGHLAAGVSENGWIIEYKSYCGRASYVLGMNKKHSTRITYVDNWPDAPESVPAACLGDTEQSYNHYTFMERVSDVRNKEVIRGGMPLTPEYAKLTKTVDLLYLNNPYDSNLLIHEIQSILPDITLNGHVVIHNPRFVLEAVDKLFVNDNWKCTQDGNLLICQKVQ